MDIKTAPKIFRYKRFWKCLVIFTAVLLIFNMTHYYIHLYERDCQYSNMAENQFTDTLQVYDWDGNHENYTYQKLIILNTRTNNAVLGHSQCMDEKELNKNEIIVVTNYIPVDLLRSKHLIYNDRPPSMIEIEARIVEIISCLQSNLNNPIVKRLYVFVEHEASVGFLRSLNLSNSEKLVIHFTRKASKVIDTLVYISECLMDRIVLMIHQDNKIGEGFEKIDFNVLRKKKLLYALTRQPSSRCCFHTWDQFNCRMKYVGSHDAFMFHVKELPASALNEINSTQVEAHELGFENLFLFTFEKQLGYTVLNPCVVLHIHHEHCVPIRNAKRRRVNTRETAFRSEITSRLF